jgi:hypothetical protein
VGQIRSQGLRHECDVNDVQRRLGGAAIAVVAVTEAAGERIAESLRAAGASVRSAIVNASALATLSAPGFDAAVLDVGEEPERFFALSA